MIYQYQCRKCNRIFDEFNHVDERDNASCCGVLAQRLICITPFQFSSEEKTYHHTSYSFGKPKWIHSKKQYGQLLRENNMIRMTTDEMKSIKPVDTNKSKRKSMVKKMVTRMKQDGVLDKVKPFFKDVLKVNVGKEVAPCPTK